MHRDLYRLRSALRPLIRRVSYRKLSRATGRLSPAHRLSAMAIQRFVTNTGSDDADTLFILADVLGLRFKLVERKRTQRQLRLPLHVTQS